MTADLGEVHVRVTLRRRVNLTAKDRDDLKTVGQDAVDLAARVAKILIGALR